MPRGVYLRTERHRGRSFISPATRRKMIATRRRNGISTITPERPVKMVAARRRNGNYGGPQTRRCCGHSREDHPVKRCD
jgi:hypothetical protein